MSNGPIEFLSDRRDQRVPSSEYGGDDGLIQPLPHGMTASEVNAARARAALSNVVVDTSVTVDSAAGRVIPG